MSEKMSVGILSVIPSTKKKPIKITNFGGFENLADSFVSDKKLCKENPSLLKRSDVMESVKSVEQTRPILLEEQYHKHLEELYKLKQVVSKKQYEHYEEVAKKLLENFVDCGKVEAVQKEINKEFEAVAQQLLFNHKITHVIYEEEISTKQANIKVDFCNKKTCRCGKTIVEGIVVRVPLNHQHMIRRKI